MKVHELIRELERYDSEREVMIEIDDKTISVDIVELERGEDWHYYVKIR